MSVYEFETFGDYCEPEYEILNSVLPDPESIYGNYNRLTPRDSVSQMSRRFLHETDI